MPYYDPDAEIDIQIRDRLRDLLEADDPVREVYPAPKTIRRLPTDNVPKTEGARVTISLLDETVSMPRAGQYSHDRAPRFFLTVQQFLEPSGSGATEEDAYDACVTLTNRFQKALMRYQADPTPGVDIRLWDALEWDARTTTEYQKGTSQWYSTSIFTLRSFGQRND